MTPMKQQAAVQEIQKLEKQLQDMQENSQQRMTNRRNELLSPVMARADSIIRAVAEQHDYDLIYDSPTLLYADSALNVMPLIRQALGVEDSAETEE
jgi:outer membrane protein